MNDYVKTGSYFISLAELKTEVHEVLNPNISVCILVAHVEHFFKLFQEYQQLFLVGEDIAVHCYDDALSNALY